MGEAVLRKALDLWGFGAARATLVAARENAVYRVETADARYALRLHRIGYRDAVELRSELQWLEAAGAGGVPAPRPIATPDGETLAEIDGVAIDVLSWVEGAPMGQGGGLAADQAEARLRDLGVAMAQLHDVSDRWAPPQGFKRPHWSREGLLGEAPLWGRFWENPRLSEAEQRVLIEARRVAQARLSAIEGATDFGLIHADLIPDNVMVSGAGVVLIDFDDGGYGFRLFDLATTINRLEVREGGAALTSALLDGYQSVRTIDLQELPLFQMMRSLTYVGWIVPRMAEPGAEERSARAISRAVGRAEEYLNQG